VADSLVVVVVRLEAKPSKVEDLRRAAEAVVDFNRSESGCIKYEIRQNRIDQRIFTIYEQWETIGALIRNSQAPHMINFAEQIAELLEFPVVVRQCTRPC
jgi:quinol monooxygenase YgiN